ncbi:glutamate racemase [Muriicola marianensis]|uniref:Glutamate racemase n=1 Tax=Muriicola marianensis TaxID=1324801 RepID=A0ABQ1QVN8_9FLAO|nr:glutamate racemase [Muriicola marianensis]GGD45735.1 glutamate racemase [Muriicola marianensis]
MDNRPIGIFDSGVGGISIWKEIRSKLPLEDTLYLADSRNAPYGEKTSREILDLSVKNTEWLLNKGCKLIVVACNTATTNAIDHLRAHYPVPFIGIEPAIKPAALGSATGKVGVLATRGTLSSKLFHSTSRNHASHIEILEQEGRGLVELIEQGKALSGETKNLIRKYLQPMLAAGIDHLVLGCTHYPHLIPLLKEELPEGIRIIDCGEAVARQTFRILEKHGLLSAEKEETTHQFYSNANHELLSHFLQGESGDIRIAYLDF